MTSRSKTNRSTPKQQTKTSTTSRLSASTAEPTLKLTRVMTDRECATVLHALRLMQNDGCMERCCDHFDDCEPLNNAEIDELCEAFNFGDFDACRVQIPQAQESKTWTPAQLAAIQPQERQNIISALRAAALAVAEFWDTLREVENEHGCMIDYSDDLINCLAGEYKTPAGFADLAEDVVWENFTQQSHTDLTYYTAGEGESDMERDRRG